MIYCSTCGKGIPKDSRFCTFCGATVPVVDPEKPNVAAPSSLSTQNSHSSRPGAMNSSTADHLNIDTTSKLEFFNNPGFYGALLVLAGFFLPWILDNTTASGMELVQTSLEKSSGVFIFIAILLILPVIGALIVLIKSFTGALGNLSGLFKWLAFLSLIFFVSLLIIGASDSGGDFMNFETMETADVLAMVGLGLWMSLAGVIIMLFNKRVIRRAKI